MPQAAWFVVWKPDAAAITTIADATWQSDRCASFGQVPSWSRDRRWFALGDVRLTNLGALRDLCDRPHASEPETVAELWACHGVQTPAQLQGMFALVVGNVETGDLWLLRDRVGMHTLYYTTTTATATTRWIAPRLRTLAPHRSNDLDPIALRDYLCCSFVPGDRTLWRDVRELRPGTCLQWPDRTTTYWEPREPSATDDRSFESCAQDLRSTLETVVRDDLPAGEPVGVYLFGGLDSSCITALASQLHDRPVHTYSIHFGADYPNELEFSDRVAAHCDTQHHILEIPPDHVWRELPATMAHLDDPIGDPLTVPNYLMGQAAMQDVGVILNGEGGDPCFGGPKNKPLLLDRLYSGVVRPPRDQLDAYLSSYKRCYPFLDRLLKPEIQAELTQYPPHSSVFAPDLARSGSYLNALMLLNIKFKGADHILTKVSNLTRAANLSGRSPLFDPRIVDFSLQIPPAYKLAGAEEKAILKAAVVDTLPHDIVYRPKSGMRVPVGRWFYQFWRRRSRRLLLSRRARIADYLEQSLIREWLDYAGDPWSRYGLKLWMLVSLEIWLQVQDDR